MNKRVLSIFWSVTTIFAVVILWYVLSRFGNIDSLFLPTPGKVWRSFLTLSHNGLWTNLGITSLRVAVAVALSFALAIPLAILMYWNKYLKSICSPLIDFIRYLPVPALIPLLIIFLGIGESVKIAVLFIGTFFQIIILIHDLLRNIPNEYYELSYVFHFNKWKLYFMQLKSILPELWDTLRVSIGLCWTYVIIAELIATDKGIGRVIKEAQRFSDSSKLFVAIISIGIVGLLIDQIMKAASEKLFPYRLIGKHNYD